MSIFPSGYATEINGITEEIQRLYATDSRPWIVGYSGGKDSTATLQLIWSALRVLPPERRTKPVHVISTDTLVENPIVRQWASNSLAAMGRAAQDQGLPIKPHRLTPELNESFWVLLIGKGYPSPREKFRWCTDRLKIRPSNRFIREMVSSSGETILVLGTRKAESRAREARMKALEASRIEARLSPNEGLPGSVAYTPIEDWSNDEVWAYLMQEKNPWGWPNKSLLTLYQGATDGGECPLVVDTSTPSCGSSRFGCWVCTMVEEDKSMRAMISNDPANEWMLPLLELRNALNEADDRHLRDFRRMNGKVQLMGEGPNVRVIPGPYTQAAREEWLRRLLRVQKAVQELGPAHVRKIELITLPELREIRRLWLEEKHEIEDALPRVYEEETGEAWPDRLDRTLPFTAGDLELWREACDGDTHLYALGRELLAVEDRHRHMQRRAGLYDSLEAVLERYVYRTEDEAVASERDAYELRQTSTRARQVALPLFGDRKGHRVDPEARKTELRALLQQAMDRFDAARSASAEAPR